MAKAKKRAKPKVRILPKKMSALIKIALADLKKAEASKKYFIDMGRWHDPIEINCIIGGDASDVVETYQKCAVCFAGAVMSGTLKGDPDRHLGVQMFPGNADQLSALDNLREGEVISAARQLGIFKSGWEQSEKDILMEAKLKGIVTPIIPEYDRGNPKPFHTAMEKLQKKLATAGF